MRRFSLLSIEGVEKTKELMEVTLGKKACDLAVVNATVFNSYTGEFLENCDVLIKGKWIVYTGSDPNDRIDQETKVIDASGRFVIPGFIDGHTHLADMLYHPYEFLRFAMGGGTTTVITETIEPYPMCGYEGIDDYLASLKEQPIKFFATSPTMASTSSEVDGISGDDLKKLLSRDDILGLGESYWSNIMNRPDTFLPHFWETLMSGKKLEGHTAGAKGDKLMAYLALGVSSCHEPIKAEEVLERLRLGIHVMVREGSTRRDLEAISEIKNADIDFRRLILASDGIGPIDLLERGYMEYLVQKAIDCGFKPAMAIQMATINVAEYFQLDGIIGGIAPGKLADMIIIPDPKAIKAELVISNGKIIAEEGNPVVPPRKHDFSPASLNSVLLPKPLKPSDFTIHARDDHTKVKVRVIDLVTKLVTKDLIITVPVIEGEIRSDTGRDILKVAAIDRAHVTGKMSVGLIKGFSIKNGAFACSSAWDTSDIIVVGENDIDMAIAVNRIYELQGGVVVCSDGDVVIDLALPIFGLLSELPMEELVRRLKEINLTMKKLGFPFDDPLRTLATLTGAAIPFIRICEEGLVDIKSGKNVDLIVSAHP
ncbi:adenine deaminase C-terminal domain-containing protein [Thermodesulfobacteriota bacterium]